MVLAYVLVTAVNRMAIYYLIYFLLIAGTAKTQPINCDGAMLCQDCIGLSNNCAWCSHPEFKGSRCMNVTRINSTCPLPHIENPLGEVVNLTERPSVSVKQFTPVAAEFRLRVGEPQSFTVTVTPTENYPLDIYILMDLSFSMTPLLNNLRSVSLALAGTLRNITADFRIGFGAFNEKPIRPFTLPNARGGSPRTDYSFRHISSLTDNVEEFNRALEGLVTVSNDDAPEAMLEGLLQSIVCTDVIGWRITARKLILVFTDQRYHTAGDAKYAGISRPHDGNCYVSRQSVTGNLDYTMWNVFDYPSIGQVRAKLQENDIIPIFASLTGIQDVYVSLAQEIPGSFFQSIGTASDLRQAFFDLRPLPPDLFLRVIRDSFDITSQRIEIFSVTESDDFIFNIEPSCPRENQRNGSACNNVLITQTASFNFTVTLRRCSARQQVINLRIPGFGMIPLTVSGICECSCQSNREINSSDCLGRGDLSCGICECHEQRFGSRCQCDRPEALLAPCLFGVGSNEFCSGPRRGRCECGLCLCAQPSPNIVPADVMNAAYFGEACECDNFNCPTGIDGLVCSGRGECGCGGNCACYNSSEDSAPYRGDRCECPTLEEVCLNSYDMLICSGQGECLCERCRCFDGFEGEYCNITSLDLQTMGACGPGDNCVACAKGVASSETDCQSFNCSVTLIDAVQPGDQYLINGIPAVRCDFRDSSNCLHIYYTIRAPEIIIHAERQGCPGLPIPIWAVVLVVLGGLLLLGILLLIIIKCIIICMDRYDYYQWLKKTDQEDFSKMQNPLYTSPELKYHNVAYGRMSPEAANSSSGNQDRNRVEVIADISCISITKM